MSSDRTRREQLPEFGFAFQPIVDVGSRRVVSWEALIRGLGGEPAAAVLRQVPTHHMHAFDEESRAAAIDCASRLGIDCRLNLNFLPQSLRTSATPLAQTLEAAHRNGLPEDRIVIEISETEVIDDHSAFAERMNKYRALGLKFAIDDFGAGHSGLNLLADFQPDEVKLDMKLVRNIHQHGPRQAIVRGICQTCFDLAIDIVAEGVETLEEFAWLHSEGVQLFQGYLFARPAFQCLPAAFIPETTDRSL